jgi:hypothetical protein
MRWLDGFKEFYESNKGYILSCMPTRFIYDVAKNK